MSRYEMVEGFMKKTTGNFLTMILIGVLATLGVSQNKKKDFQAQFSDNSIPIEKIGMGKDVCTGKNRFQKTVEYRSREIDGNDTNILLP
jgi:hypothetical protein